MSSSDEYDPNTSHRTKKSSKPPSHPPKSPQKPPKPYKILCTPLYDSSKTPSVAQTCASFFDAQEAPAKSIQIWQARVTEEKRVVVVAEDGMSFGIFKEGTRGGVCKRIGLIRAMRKGRGGAMEEGGAGETDERGTAI